LEYLFRYIRDNKNNLEKNSTILEFGSGLGTQQLIKLGYNMLSIEQDSRFINLYHNNYCYAPLKNDWYDLDAVSSFVKNINYDAVLIDGPAHVPHRKRILDVPNLNLNKFLIVDDIERPPDRELFEILKNNRNYRDYKTYGIIFSE